MATRKKQEEQQAEAPGPQQVRFVVEPGAKVQVTIEVGEDLVEGKLPLTIQVEPVEKGTVRPVPIPLVPEGRLHAGFNSLRRSLSRYDLAAWLFILALAIYLLTRLVGLTHFPIYFFTDEAIQSQSMIDLMNNGYKDSSGEWLPVYFKNGEYLNLSLSVYLQWLPAVLFGKSALATRATSVIVTLIAAVSVGIMLRDIFKLKYWWAGTLLLSITPAWFLHSRTAFETVEFVAFYAGMLCAYLFYRYKSPRYLYLAVFLGALSFYSYSPAQFIMPLTAAGLLLSDLRYHWENRRTILIGLALAVVLALPYVRNSINNPTVPFAHLHTLGSYWFGKITLPEKIARYFSEFGLGLSPWYWYLPNNRDLVRHLMRGYGNIMMATLPFALLGLAQALRRIHMPSYRTIIIALLVSPAAAALVQISITRAMMFVIPAALLTAIGLEQFLGWIEDPNRGLAELAAGPGPTPRRIAAALLIFGVGIFIAFISKETLNFIAITALALVLAAQVSGLLERFAQARVVDRQPAHRWLWSLPQKATALSVFIILSGVNIFMLSDALKNGPLWFRDYGMGGMQYGAFQIFDIIDEYLEEHPGTRIIFSPDWANGTDIVARYMLKDPSSIQFGSIRGHITHKLPLDQNVLFIITPQEYEAATQTEKFTDIQVERIVPYPDGNPGFYFLRLRYSDKADELFAAENAVREKLQEATVTLDGQEVKLRFTYLDSDSQDKSILAVFDNDPFTVTKTYERNPFVIEMTFPDARTLNGFSIIIGSSNVEITLRCYASLDEQPIEYSFAGQGTKNQPQLSFELPEPTLAQVLQVEVLEPNSPEGAKVHIWELKLR